jgi:sugar lactone lactonase YvrE
MWPRLFGCCLLAFGLLAACGDDDGGSPPVMPPPDLITFHSPNLQPEGLEYDEVRGRFVVGSTTQGTIHTVDDNGNLEVLVANPGVAGTLGIHIDGDRDLLFAAASVGPGMAGMGVYDLATGDVIRVVDISEVFTAGQQLANDVVVDSFGAAYVTDTVSNGVYTIDAAGVVSEFSGGTGLGLANGIELYNDEVLLIARIGGPLMRMQVGDPGSLEPVETDVPVSGDGIVFTPQGDLAVVTIGGPAAVILLHSDDDWQSATAIGTWNSATITDTTPTTAAIRGDDVYVIFARLFDETNSRYDIERVVFAAPE